LYFLKNGVKAANNRPNIIFVLPDDLGWADVSWNNQNTHTTPFLDFYTVPGALTLR